VLVFVMAAGVNYNGIWAALGQPISPLDGHKQPFHVAGSDASGIVWAVGRKVKRWKVGDEVVVHCNQDDGDDEECNGGDPMFSSSQRIWGYETPDGSFAQFCRVQSRQLMERPRHLTWEEAACYTLTLATAYRMLFGHAPHTLKPGDNVLVWGASGGLGVFGLQLAAASGANAIGVISDETKRDYVLQLGAKGVINRKDFAAGDSCRPSTRRNTPIGRRRPESSARRSGTPPARRTSTSSSSTRRADLSGLDARREARRHGGVLRGTTGSTSPSTPATCGCARKRIQGSHFAHLKQAAAANQFVIDRRIDPCMSEVFPWEKIPLAHTKMWKNQHAPATWPCSSTRHAPACAPSTTCSKRRPEGCDSE
jgi:crotonyl-CoA carboxylase/reductase